MQNKFCFIIPVYNHGATVEAVLTSLKPYGFPIIVVDDGNDQRNKDLILAAVKKFDGVSLVTAKKNGGKGKAFALGIREANRMGYTHAFQIDADGQHDSNCCSSFIQASEENPKAIICGVPVFDSSVPEHRKNGRKISNNYGKFVALNGNVGDILCGCRIYPVDVYIKILNQHAIIDSRMAFDIDILIHYLWKGVEEINLPVNVTYPQDGVSNFRMVRDNLHIAAAYTRLTIGMIFRLPKLLYFMAKRHSKKQEK